MCSNHQQCICHSFVNSTNRPRIWVNRNQIRPNPGTIGRICQKMACEIFKLRTAQKSRGWLRFQRFFPRATSVGFLLCRLIARAEMSDPVCSGPSVYQCVPCTAARPKSVYQCGGCTTGAESPRRRIECRRKRRESENYVVPHETAEDIPSHLPKRPATSNSSKTPVTKAARD